MVWFGRIEAVGVSSQWGSLINLQSQPPWLWSEMRVWLRCGDCCEADKAQRRTYCHHYIAADEECFGRLPAGTVLELVGAVGFDNILLVDCYERALVVVLDSSMQTVMEVMKNRWVLLMVQKRRMCFEVFVDRAPGSTFVLSCAGEGPEKVDLVGRFAPLWREDCRKEGVKGRQRMWSSRWLIKKDRKWDPSDKCSAGHRRRCASVWSQQTRQLE